MMGAAACFIREAGEVKTGFANGRRIVTSDLEQAQKVVDLSDEAMIELCAGMSSIGYLISCIDIDKKGFDDRELEDIGHLVRNVADITMVVSNMATVLRESLSDK